LLIGTRACRDLSLFLPGCSFATHVLKGNVSVLRGGDPESVLPPLAVPARRKRTAKGSGSERTFKKELSSGGGSDNRSKVGLRRVAGACCSSRSGKAEDAHLADHNAAALDHSSEHAGGAAAKLDPTTKHVFGGARGVAESSPALFCKRRDPAEEGRRGVATYVNRWYVLPSLWNEELLSSIPKGAIAASCCPSLRELPSARVSGASVFSTKTAAVSKPGCAGL
jgi:hypothetical protein